MDGRLGQLLRMAGSADVTERTDAARSLAAFASEPAAANALRRLMQDEENLAPVDAAARALIERGDLEAMTVYATAWAEATDPQYGDILGDHVRYANCGETPIVALCTQLLRHADETVRSGAQGILDWVGGGEGD